MADEEIYEEMNYDCSGYLISTPSFCSISQQVRLNGKFSELDKEADGVPAVVNTSQIPYNVYCDYEEPVYSVVKKPWGTASEKAVVPALSSQSATGTEQPIVNGEKFLIMKKEPQFQQKIWIYAMTILVAIGSLSSFSLLCCYIFFQLKKG